MVYLLRNSGRHPVSSVFCWLLLHDPICFSVPLYCCVSCKLKGRSKPMTRFRSGYFSKSIPGSLYCLCLSFERLWLTIGSRTAAQFIHRKVSTRLSFNGFSSHWWPLPRHVVLLGVEKWNFGKIGKNGIFSIPKMEFWILFILLGFSEIVHNKLSDINYLPWNTVHLDKDRRKPSFMYFIHWLSR